MVPGPVLDVISVQQAFSRIRGIVKKSPLDFSPLLSKEFGCELYLKKEHISLTGSYKERGALNKLLLLTDEEKKNGVVCSSAGNHAQAVSHHSTRLGIDSVIVMPETTPFVKIRATRSFGGKVILHGQGYDDAYEKAMEIAVQENRTFVHAFNDRDVCAGQGTVALELLEQNPYLDAVIVPVGGGGLLAGMLLALKHINPRIKVYGVEAKSMPGMSTSRKEGKITVVPKLRTIADGIAVQKVGDTPYEVIKRLVEDIVLVDEDEIASAILTLLEQEKTVVEGSGATAIAAIASGKIDVKGQVVAAVLTGGNIDMSILGRIIDKGLVKDGRLARFNVVVEDYPGNLARLATLISEQGANVRDISHERAFMKGQVGVHMITNVFTLETKGHEHIDQLKEALTKAKYNFTT